jgi:alpha-D-ribose 1-methylphosphonate 5-triphosphate synthase subunit PhnG
MRERFFLGEVPVSVSQILLKDKDGNIYQGGAVILRDDIELARSIAILDAVLCQCVEPMHEAAELLLQAVAASLSRDSAIQAAIGRTRVDFSVVPGGGDAV